MNNAINTTISTINHLSVGVFEKTLYVIAAAAISFMCGVTLCTVEVLAESIKNKFKTMKKPKDESGKE